MINATFCLAGRPLNLSNRCEYRTGVHGYNKPTERDVQLLGVRVGDRKVYGRCS